MRREEEALKVSSEVAGPAMNKLLKKIEDQIEEWHLEGVETQAIQRFAARIMNCLRRTGVLVAVDHVIFKQEHEFYHVLESAFGHPDIPLMTRDEIKEKTRDLLRSVISPDLRERFESIDDGFTWRELNSSQGQSQQPMSMEESVMPSLEDVSPLVDANPDLESTGKFWSSL